MFSKILTMLKNKGKIIEFWFDVFFNDSKSPFLFVFYIQVKREDFCNR